MEWKSSACICLLHDINAGTPTLCVCSIVLFKMATRGGFCNCSKTLYAVGFAGLVCALGLAFENVEERLLFCGAIVFVIA